MSKNEVWRRLGQVFNKIQKQPEGFCKYTEKVIHQKKTPFVVNCSRGSLIEYIHKIYQKTNISHPLIHTRTCAY